MTFLALKCVAQMLLFEITSFLINSETENLEILNFHRFRTYTLFFVVGELKHICANLQFANQH